MKLFNTSFKHINRLKRLFILSFIIVFPFWVSAQDFAFGVKGGLTVGFQKWNNFERSPLPSWNGAIFLENIGEDLAFSTFGQVGYHVKGSRLKYYYRSNDGDVRKTHSDTKFENISLVIGAKKYHTLRTHLKGYYLLGVRGDYNVKYSSPVFAQTFLDEDVNKITYGFTIGGGFEIPLTPLIGMNVELQISPDLRPQIYYPKGKYRYTNSSGVPIPVNETKVTNTVFEITLGFRFLRLVEEVD